MVFENCVKETFGYRVIQYVLGHLLSVDYRRLATILTRTKPIPSKLKR